MSEIFTWDNLLHSVLGGVFLGLAMLTHYLPWYWPHIFVVILVLFIRELTQVQCKYHDNDFLKGWTVGPKGVLNLHHTAEWLVPTIVLTLLLWWVG